MTDDAVSLKEHIEALLREKDEAVKTALAALDRRLDGMNEFRQTLSDQTREFMPRTDAERRLKALEDLVTKKAGFSGGWAMAVGVVGLIALVVSFIMNTGK